MATILRYVEPGYIERHGVGSDALDKQMDALRMRMNKTVLQGSALFRSVTPRGGTYKESTYGNGVELPRLSEDTSALPSVTPIPGYSTSVTVSTLRSAMRVERAMSEDELFPVAKKMQSGLLRSGKLCLEYAMADRINNITSSSAAYLAPDGLAPISASHCHERRETGTWSNSETGATLTYSAFSTARANLRKRVDEFGYVMSVFPKLLVAPPDIEKNAREIKESDQEPETSTNRKNVWKSDAWNVFVYDYMTDTNAWFIYGDMDDDSKAFILAQAVTPNIAPLTGGDTTTDTIWGVRLRMRFATGVTQEGLKNIAYNAGPS
jgi:hypothetical protein